MPKARKHIVCLSETPYYHVSSRCVRRAFLCGVDSQSGQSYEHRRIWIEDRIRVLSSLFSIDLCAYAVMSNHYHLVVKINSQEPKSWSDEEVLHRWTAMFRGPLLVQRYRAGGAMAPAELDTLQSIIATYRNRLGDLSWFMKCLNEPIARQANAEDGCTGHFWESRFHSQPLNSERALLSAMSYVDLNPVRSNVAKTPETSDYTSIKARIEGDYRRNTLDGAVSRMLRSGELNHFGISTRSLLPFSDEIHLETRHSSLPIRQQEYLKLVDITGRIVVGGKRGRIDPAIASILQRIRISDNEWIQACSAFRQHYRNGDILVRQIA